MCHTSLTRHLYFSLIFLVTSSWPGPNILGAQNVAGTQNVMGAQTTAGAQNATTAQNVTSGAQNVTSGQNTPGAQNTLGAQNTQAAQNVTGTTTADPKITSVAVYRQTVAKDDSKSQSIILEIHGSGLAAEDKTLLQVLVFPDPTHAVTVVSSPDDGSLVRAQFEAPLNYAVQGVAVSVGRKVSPTYTIEAPACDVKELVTSAYDFVSERQADDKYGRGVARNFHVIQLSIVNGCSISVIVPLASIVITPMLENGEGNKPEDTQKPVQTTSNKTPDQTTKGGGLASTAGIGDGAGSGIAIEKAAYPPEQAHQVQEDCQRIGTCVVPYSLDHVTSVYSTDRKLTGRRAIFFNSLLAAGTIGSAVQLFFGPGFAQGVSIWGGGFTNAAQTIFKDMSAEQLQNITSQSFAAAEQIGPGGSVSKFLFVPKINGGAAEEALKKAMKQNKKLQQDKQSQASSKDYEETQNTLEKRLAELNRRSALAEAALKTGNVKIDFTVISALTSSETTAAHKPTTERSQSGGGGGGGR